MTIVCRIIGPAGAGKTSHMIGDRSGRRGVLGEWIENRQVNPYQIGYFSFTRAARREAAERAALISGEPMSQLEQYGHFRTVHSSAYKALGAGKELLVDDKESRLWVAQALGVAPDAAEIESGEDEPSAVSEASSDEMNALRLWDVARSRLESIEVSWEAAAAINEFVPDLDAVRKTIDQYEQMKRLDGRQDFTDLLGRFAGVRFGLAGHSLDAIREGECPDLKIVVFDEWQDASALLDRCANRLIEFSDVAYFCGDPMQAIYGFGGSHPRFLMGRTPTEGRERVLQQSHRCPKAIVDLGEEILRPCSDYWDRGVKPRDAEGQIDVAMLAGDWIHEIDPRESWLIIARSNAHVRRLVKRLDAEGIPWLPTRGHGGKWAAPVRRQACLGLISLEHGHVLSAAEWTAALKQLPSKNSEGEIIKHGMKSAWNDQEHKPDELTDLEHLGEWGATDLLIDRIRDGRWTSLVDNGLEFRDAWKRWGHEAVLEPKVQCGTIHSVKGAEGDNVALLTTTSRQCTKSMDFEESANEERRVAYVGVTRTRQRLLVLREKSLHCMDLPV